MLADGVICRDQPKAWAMASRAAEAWALLLGLESRREVSRKGRTSGMQERDAVRTEITAVLTSS